MHLQTEDSAARNLWIVQIGADMTVNCSLDSAAHGDNLVSIPIIGLEERLAGFVGQDSAPVFFIKFAPPTRADVRLRPFHLVLAKAFAAELDTAVLFVRHQFYLK